MRQPVKLEALDHPKTLDLAARLRVEMPTVIGYLELFWAFTAKKAPRGDIGKWPDGAIARACYWNSDPAVFVEGLLAAGFIESHPDHRYLVHDWCDHAPRWVLSKLARAKLQIFTKNDITQDCSGGDSGDCSRDCSGDSVREGKGREEYRGEREETRAPKNSNGKSRRPSRQAPEDFDPDPSVALSRLPDMDVEVEIQKLRDWEFKTPRSNWPAVWRNWIQRCVETGIYARKANGNGSKPSLRFLTGPEEYELWKQLTADGKHWDTQEQWDEFYRHRVA